MTSPKLPTIKAVFEVQDGVISNAYVIDPDINPSLSCVAVVKLEDGKVVGHDFVYGFSTETIAKTAENKFLEACEKHIPDFKAEYALEDDLDAILDDGYATYGKNAICITWPIRHKSFEELAEAKRSTMESVMRGLEQSNRGETKSLGSFAQFIEDHKDEIRSDALQIFVISDDNCNEKQVDGVE